nr:MAG TPA: Head fiber protein [Caudoviricetes sp.]
MIMKFLDEIGLAYFWEKIKASFVKTKGASEIEMDDDNEGLRVNNVSSSSTTLVPSGFVSYNNIGDETDMVARLQYGDLLLSKIHLKYGTSSQILIADGSTKAINAANGICGLDANGRIPLAQLGNLDMSLFKLVTSLPSSGESNKIYIVKDGSDANDVYQEYYYTNGAWEKIGTHAVKVDLTPYAKKTEAVKNVDFRGVESDGTQTSITASRNLVYTLGDGSEKVVAVPLAEPRTTGGRPYPGQNGFMRSSDKAKLDGIADGANNYTLPTASASALGGIQVGYAANGRNYPVQLSGGKAYVNVPWTDTNTTYDLSPYAKTADVNKALAKKVDVVSGKGLSTEDFTAALKTKLNGIATGATADSAITTAEIDALFA